VAETVVQFITETKKQTKERLIAEGRWKDAYTFRDREKAAGKTPAQAWAAMVSVFQPLEGPAAMPARKEGGEIKRPHRRKRLNWRDQIEWVYRHLKEESPAFPRGGEGLFSLHLWARENQDEFFKLVLPRLLPTRMEVNKEAEGVEEKNEAVDLVEKFMRENGYEGKGAVEGPGGDPGNDAERG
jgi:hypothetical protein